MDDHNYPLVSYVVQTYNHAKFAEDAMASALSQDYPNLEIIISDDASSDGTFDILQQYLQKHPTDKKIVLNRNEKNMGVVPHLNHLVQHFAHGDIIILTGGDDISLPDRTSRSVEKMLALGVDCLGTNYQYIDGAGQKQERFGLQGDQADVKYTIVDYIKNIPITPLGPTKIFHRQLYDVFGTLNDDCQTEDSTLTFRALLLNGIGRISTVCVLYRWHENNLSAHDSLMTKINPTLIYRQYKSDLTTAYRKGFISQMQYIKASRLIYDYKLAGIFVRDLYKATGIWKKHLLGLLFVLNPCVLKRHRDPQWLSYVCPELYMVRTKIRCMLKK